MALVYEIGAIKLRATGFGASVTFLGTVGLRITTPTDSFVIDDVPQELTLLDLSTRQPITPLISVVTQADFTVNLVQNRSAVYYQWAQTTPGTAQSAGTLDIYVLQISGDRLPLPRPGTDWIAHNQTLLTSEVLLGTSPSSPFFDGNSFDIDDFDDIRSVTGTDEGPKDIAPEPASPSAPVLNIARSVFGDDTANRIDGPAGNTLIEARGGNDRVVDTRGANNILAGDGDDRVLTGRFNDVIDGQAGDDVLIAGAGDDFVAGGAGNDRLVGGDGNDILLGRDGDDVIRTTRGDDMVDGGDGADTILGFSGAETLRGGDGADSIAAGTGDDTITGGAGDDRLSGGPGRDVFVFRDGFGTDRLLDFTDRSDRLDFVNHALIRGIDDLTLRAVGDSVVIDDGTGGRIVLAGVALADLTAADFLF